MRYLKRVAAGLIVGVGTIVGVSGANATVTQYEWTGTVVSPGDLVGVFAGDAISGNFFYDNATPVSPGPGSFENAISSHSFSVGSFSGTFFGQTVATFNDTIPGDQFDIRGSGTGYAGDTDGGINPTQLFWRLNDNSGTAIPDLVTLPVLLDLADWPDTNTVGLSRIIFGASVPGFSVAFIIDTLNPVVDVSEFTCSGFGPPFDTALTISKKTKRTIPAKMTLEDAAAYVITDADIVAPPVITVEFNGVIFGDDAVDDAALESVGKSNDGNAFSYNPDTQQWEYRIGTKQFASSGTYTVDVRSGDETEYTISATGGNCNSSFARQN